MKTIDSKNYSILQILAFVVIFGLLVMLSCKKDSASGIGTPQRLQATPGEHSITLTWDSVQGSDSYRIYWSDQNSTITKSSNIIDNITTSSYVHSGIDPTKTYYYGVSAVKGTNESELSNVAHATPDLSLPDVPSGLSVSPSESALTISWNNVNYAQYYRLYWTSDGTTPTIASDVIDNIMTNSYKHNSLDYKKTYKYCVCAINQKGAGNLSSAAEGTPTAPPMTVPTGFSASGTSNINLTWDAYPISGVTFTIQRNGSEIASGITGNSYTDNSPVSGSKNSYKIKAVLVSESRSSDYSSEVSVIVYTNIYESERNGPTGTLGTTNWGYYREHSTESMQYFTIYGAYSGAYAGYNAASYKNYDWDIFGLSLEKNDELIIQVLQGNTSGLWGMSLSITLHMTDGSDLGNKPTISGNTYTWNILYNANETVSYSYLTVSMPDNLINTGPYNYSLKVTINRSKK